MPDPEKVGFQIIGEVDADKFTELCSVLGKFSVAVKSATELDMVSPSVAIEYVKGVDGLSVPAVTELSIQNFLESEGEDSSAARAMSSGLMRTLMAHVGHKHAYARQGDQLFNYYRHPCQGCNCPLVGVVERSEWSWTHLDAVKPSSIVNFSQLPFEEARKLDFKGLGKKRFGLISRLARQITADTSVEAAEL